jgi:hypothetical protein
MTSNQRKAIKRRLQSQKVIGPSLKLSNYSGLQQKCEVYGLRSGTQRNADDMMTKRRGTYIAQ